jgi:small subunit ribosomal protein S19
MSRSTYKLPILNYKLEKKIKKNIKSIKIWSRNIEVYPNLYNRQFEIHNGIKFLKLTITPEMQGHKLGEFVPTRKPCVFKKKDSDKKKK